MKPSVHNRPGQRTDLPTILGSVSSRTKKQQFCDGILLVGAQNLTQMHVEPSETAEKRRKNPLDLPSFSPERLHAIVVHAELPNSNLWETWTLGKGLPLL